MVKAKHPRPICLGSLQVGYSGIRYHLKSPASLTHLIVNHLCSTTKDFYWRGELFSRPSTFSIFHFGSLLLLPLPTPLVVIGQLNSGHEEQFGPGFTHSWQKCVRMTKRETSASWLLLICASSHCCIAFLLSDLAVCSITGLKSTTLLNISLINL